MLDVGDHCSSATVCIAEIRLPRIPRFRLVMRESMEFWATVHLSWPEAIVNHFLEISEENPKYLVLDTNEGGRDNMEEKYARWATALTSTIPNTRKLIVRIHNGHGDSRLATALTTAAPNLETFILNLGKNVQAIDNLFSYAAPRLSTISLYTTLRVDLARFPSLRHVTMHVGTRNYRTLLSTLEPLSQIVSLVLIGTENAARIRISPAPQPISLESCSILTIRNMEANRADYLRSRIGLPDSHVFQFWPAT